MDLDPTDFNIIPKSQLNKITASDLINCIRILGLIKGSRRKENVVKQYLTEYIKMNIYRG